MCIGGCPVAASDAVSGGLRLLTSPAADARAIENTRSAGCQPLFFLLPRESVIIPPAVLVLLDSLLTSEEEEEEEGLFKANAGGGGGGGGKFIQG